MRTVFTRVFSVAGARSKGEMVVVVVAMSVSFAFFDSYLLSHPLPTHEQGRSLAPLLDVGEG
jgi:hypothetical protein